MTQLLTDEEVLGGAIVTPARGLLSDDEVLGIAPPAPLPPETPAEAEKRAKETVQLAVDRGLTLEEASDFTLESAQERLLPKQLPPPVMPKPEAGVIDRLQFVVPPAGFFESMKDFISPVPAAEALGEQALRAGKVLAKATGRTLRQLIQAGPRVTAKAAFAPSLLPPGLSPGITAMIPPELKEQAEQSLRGFLENWQSGGVQQWIARKIKEWETEHPDWEPERIESINAIADNPQALFENVLATAPHMVGAIASAVVTGPAGAFLFTYSVEGEAAYEQALEEIPTLHPDWTPEQVKQAAEQHANTVGVINGIIEAFGSTQMLKIITGKGGMVKQAVSRSLDKLHDLWRTVPAGEMTKTLASAFAVESVQEAIQTAVERGSATWHYTKDFGWDVLEEMGIAGIIGGFAGMAFGGAGRLVTRPGVPAAEAPTAAPAPAEAPGVAPAPPIAPEAAVGPPVAPEPPAPPEPDVGLVADAEFGDVPEPKPTPYKRPKGGWLETATTQTYGAIRSASAQARGFAGSVGKVFTRFTGLEKEVQRDLVAFEEERVAMPQRAAERTFKVVGKLNDLDRRTIQQHMDNPGKYALPEHLESVVKELKKDIADTSDILEAMGYAADWPNSRIAFLERRIAELEERKPVTEKGRQSVQDEISRYQAQIEDAEGLGYVHRVTKRPDITKRVWNWMLRRPGRRISAKPTGLIGRVFATIDEAEAAGYDVATLEVAHADMLYKAGIAASAFDLIDAIDSNPDLSLPADDAPNEWVKISGRALQKGKMQARLSARRYSPLIAEAVEELVYSHTSHALVRGYDALNAAMKMVGFYNPFIMSKNDLYQGWRLSGWRFFANIPRAVKIWKTKGPKYQAMKKAGLFHGVMNYRPAVDALIENMMDEVRLTQGKRVAKWLKSVLKPQDFVKTIQRFNQMTTWNMDEVLRIAARTSLEDGRFQKDFGMSEFELTELANDFMANYGKVPQQTRRVLNRGVFTPTYRISMARVLAKMWTAPRRFWPQLLRHYGYKLFVSYVLPGLVAMIMGKKWADGKSEKGYKIIIKGASGQEHVFSLSDPLLEEAKLTQRPIFQTVEFNLAAVPNMAIGLLRGPKYRAKVDTPFNHLFKLGTPFYREIRIMADEDKAAVEKIVNLFALAYSYRRRAQKGDDDNAAESLAKALSIWTDWREQYEDVLPRIGYKAGKVGGRALKRRGKLQRKKR